MNLELNLELETIFQALGPRLSQCVKMLIDGVAFHSHHDSKIYNVFSHAGDELGTLSAAELSFLIHFFKQRGRPIGKCLSLTPLEPAFTLAWVDWLIIDGKRI